MNDFSPIVLTSKAAAEDLNHIKSRHADILSGMQAQADRVAQYRQQQEQIANQKTLQDNQLAKEKAEADRQTKELEIKQAALLM